MTRANTWLSSVMTGVTAKPETAPRCSHTEYNISDSNLKCWRRCAKLEGHDDDHKIGTWVIEE